MEHPQLLEQAFAGYLTNAKSNNVSVWPGPMNIFAGENNVDKDGQRIVCYVPEGDVGGEEPPLSGNRKIVVTVELRSPFQTLTPADKKNNVPDPLPSHQNLADILQAQMLSAGLADGLEAAQSGLTVFGL